jgi:hypothetical protein
MSLLYKRCGILDITHHCKPPRPITGIDLHLKTTHEYFAGGRVIVTWIMESRSHVLFDVNEVTRNLRHCESLWVGQCFCFCFTEMFPRQKRTATSCYGDSRARWWVIGQVQAQAMSHCSVLNDTLRMTLDRFQWAVSCFGGSVGFGR